MKILIIFSIFLFAPICFGSQLVSENFDDQDFTDTGLSANAGGATIQSQAFARSGSYVVMFDGSITTEGLQYTFGTPVAENGGESYIKFYAYFPSGGWDWENISSTGLKLVRWFWSDDDNTYMVKPTGLCSTDEFWIDTGWGNPPGFCIDELVTLNTWHKIEFYLKHDDTGGRILIIFDDVSATDWQNIDTEDCATCGTGTINWVRLASGNGFGSAGHYYVDDVEIWDEFPSGGSDTTALIPCTLSNVSIGN